MKFTIVYLDWLMYSLLVWRYWDVEWDRDNLFEVEPQPENLELSRCQCLSRRHQSISILLLQQLTSLTSSKWSRETAKKVSINLQVSSHGNCTVSVLVTICTNIGKYWSRRRSEHQKLGNITVWSLKLNLQALFALSQWILLLLRWKYFWRLPWKQILVIQNFIKWNQFVMFEKMFTNHTWIGNKLN